MQGHPLQEVTSSYEFPNFPAILQISQLSKYPYATETFYLLISLKLLDIHKE